MPAFTTAAHAVIPVSVPVPSADSPDELVIFLHLPRSSGATLNRIIAQQFPPEAIVKVGGKSRAATHADIVAVPGGAGGHYSFGTHAAVALVVWFGHTVNAKFFVGLLTLVTAAVRWLAPGAVVRERLLTGFIAAFGLSLVAL